MNLLFDRRDQEAKLLGYFPKGKAYKKTRERGSNYNNLILWLSATFSWLVDIHNEGFKYLFLCMKGDKPEYWNLDYNIPNEIFYEDTDNKKDVFALKYLMRGNQEWNFRAIANLYDIDVKIEKPEKYLEGRNRLPFKLRHIINNGPVISIHSVVVTLGYKPTQRLPYPLPVILESNRQVEKIKKMFNIIKQAHTIMVYLESSYTLVTKTERDILPAELPYKLGTYEYQDIEYQDIEYQDIEYQDKIEFCEGLES